MFIPFPPLHSSSVSSWCSAASVFCLRHAELATIHPHGYLKVRYPCHRTQVQLGYGYCFYFSALDSFTVWYQVYMMLTSLQFLCRYETFHPKEQGFLFRSSFSPTGKLQPHFPQLYIQVLCGQGLSCVRPLDRGSDNESRICSLHKLRVSWRHVVLAFWVLKPFARNSEGCITVAHEWFTVLSQTKYWHFILSETQSVIISWARLRLEWLINRCCL